MKYSPIDDFRRSAETSAEACKARCEGHPECAFFSFLAKDLPDDNGCSLFGSAATFEGNKSANTFVTGPAACPGEILSSSYSLSFKEEIARVVILLFSEETEGPKECRGFCSCEPVLPCGLGEGAYPSFLSTASS